MVKKLIVLTAMILALTAGRALWAEEMGGPMMGGMKEGKGGAMMAEKMKMMGAMHGMMQKSSMVASNDGGVIVMAGNKLYKYDKDLNLVKEVELKMSCPEDMQKMCPLMGKDGAMKQPAEEESEEK